MNTARLVRILQDVVTHVENDGVKSHLDAYITHLTNVFTSPGDVGTYEAFEEVMGDFYAVLDKAPTNTYAPSSMAVLDHLGGLQLAGRGLKERLEKVRQGQGLPAEHTKHLQTIQQEFTSFYERVSTAHQALGDLDVGPPDEPGTDLGFVFPREFVDDLQGFRKQLRAVSITLPIIHRVFGGKVPEEVKIQSLESSDLSIFLNIPPDVASLILQHLIGWGLTVLQGITALKNAKQVVQQTPRLEEAGVAKEIEEITKRHVNESIEEKSLELQKMSKDPTITRADTKFIAEQTIHYLSNDVSIEVSTKVTAEGENADAETVGKLAATMAKLGPQLRELRAAEDIPQLGAPEIEDNEEPAKKAKVTRKAKKSGKAKKSKKAAKKSKKSAKRAKGTGSDDAGDTDK